jgi:hypothetical protein
VRPCSPGAALAQAAAAGDAAAVDALLHGDATSHAARGAQGGDDDDSAANGARSAVARAAVCAAAAGHLQLSMDLLVRLAHGAEARGAPPSSGGAKKRGRAEEEAGEGVRGVARAVRWVVTYVTSYSYSSPCPRPAD